MFLIKNHSLWQIFIFQGHISKFKQYSSSLWYFSRHKTFQVIFKHSPEIQAVFQVSGHPVKVIIGNNYFSSQFLKCNLLLSTKDSFLFCLEFICQKCSFISLYLWNIILHTCQVSFLAIIQWLNDSRLTTNLELVIHCIIVRNKTLQVCRLIFHKYRRMNKQLWKMNSEWVVTMSVVVRCISVYL